ncbi:hypothetical protein BH11MYX4_BH11MYX4_09690 [soil metagenome]
MKLASMSLGLALAVSLVAACSGSNGSAALEPQLPDGVDGGPPPGTEPGSPANDPPHALGTILLGESHASGASSAQPIVSVSFVPDATKAAACRTMLEGCELSVAPKCKESATTGTGCALGHACTLDDACAAVCKVIPQCTTPCGKDEACIATDAKTGAGTCKKRESFDAGPIAFSGTTTAITLYPPYAYEGDGKGAPFLAGSALRVQASGAAGAGFNAFDETFTGTTFLQTSPSLGDVPRENVFGSGPLTLTWVPGKDSVLVTVSGPGGSATCKAADAAGQIAVPRAVIDRVLTTEGAASTTLGVSIARQRKETKKDKQAKGTLTGQTVQTTAWVDLVTTSIESASFQGCGAGSAACGDACVDLKTDKANCGACGKACSGTQQCVAGKCAAGGCVLGPENTLAACSDGCSNDGDPYIDCDDFDCCPVRKDCPVTTSCGKPK